MSLREDVAELKNEMARLVREAMAEVKAEDAPAPEDKEKDRAERRAQQELKSYARRMNQRTNLGSRPTSSKRRDELQHRYQELRSPAKKTDQKKVEDAKKTGDTIAVVVVDNGVFKTGNFFIDGTLTAVV